MQFEALGPFRTTTVDGAIGPMTCRSRLSSQATGVSTESARPVRSSNHCVFL
jgi:hypothetical protein